MEIFDEGGDYEVEALQIAVHARQSTVDRKCVIMTRIPWTVDH